MHSMSDEKTNNIESRKRFSADSGILTIPASSSFSASDLDDSSSALASPSSAFSISSLGGIQHSYVNAILLCQWDNILGPRLEHVWYIQGRPEPYTDMLRFITSQALGGEICRDTNSNQVDFKFFDIPDKGIIIPSFIFSAQGTTGLALHSLALVIPNSELTIYMHQAELIHSCFMRIVAKLRVICCKQGFSTTGLADLSLWLGSCMQMLSSLQEVGLPLQINLDYSAFNPVHTIEVDFLRHAITSHLTTFNRSVVVGKNADRINVMVYTLGLFCWDSERLCSRQALSEHRWPYCQELCIQGCIKERDDTLHLSTRDLFCSRYPTTIIDIERREVTQSSSPLEHQRMSHSVLLEELEELYRGGGGFGSESVLSFQSFSVQESMVKDLIDDIHRLPPDYGIREAYIKHFMYTLQRKAYCLLKYVEGESAANANGQSSSRVNVKKLRHDLGLQLEGDFKMVLSMAEKLKPGMYNVLLGEKKYDNEYLPTMADIL